MLLVDENKPILLLKKKNNNKKPNPLRIATQLGPEDLYLDIEIEIYKIQTSVVFLLGHQKLVVTWVLLFQKALNRWGDSPRVLHVASQPDISRLSILKCLHSIHIWP